MIDIIWIKNFLLSCENRWKNMGIIPYFIYIGGSFLNGTHSEGSDVDIICVCNKEICNYHEYIYHNNVKYSFMFDDIKLYNSWSKRSLNKHTGTIDFYYLKEKSPLLLKIYNKKQFKSIMEKQNKLCYEAINSLWCDYFYIVKSFLEENFYQKDLYHFLLVQEIIENKKTYLIKDFKQGLQQDQVKQIFKDYYNKLFYHEEE